MKDEILIGLVFVTLIVIGAQLLRQAYDDKQRSKDCD